MIAFLYRWRLKPGREGDFEAAWAHVTAELREKCGSLGSSLHRGEDGLHYAYAQWPNREAREDACVTGEAFARAREAMRDATEEALPDVELTPMADYLVFESR